MGSRSCEVRWIVLGGRDVSYCVRVSSRAKRVRLEISKDRGLLVVIPKRFSLADVPNVLKEKSHWILRKLEYFNARRASEPIHRLGDGDAVPYRGKSLALDICIRPGGRPTVRREKSLLRIVLPDHEPSAVRKTLDNWYRQEARRVVTERVESLADVFGSSYDKIYIYIRYLLV